MENRPGEEPHPELTPNEPESPEKKEVDRKKASDDILIPPEDETDEGEILRANALHTHFAEEEKALEQSQLELERKARREAPPVIRNPRNKPKPDIT